MAISSTHNEEVDRPAKSPVVGHLACPKCGAEKVARSRAYGSDRLAIRLLPRRPYRCLRCYHRFWHAETFTADKRRVRTWGIILGLIVLVLCWKFLLSGNTAANTASTEVGKDPPSSQISSSRNNGVGLEKQQLRSKQQQRKLIEASGFQPPRDAQIEISELANAGISRAQIREKLGVAQVLAVSTPEVQAAELAPEPTVKPWSKPAESASKQTAPLDEEAAAEAQTSIATMLELWKRAWEQGNSERYLEFYAEQFRPSSGLPRERWRQQRLSRVVPSKKIRLSLSDLKVELATDLRSASVTFNQQYSSAGYGETSLKQLQLNRIANQWYILTEQELTTR